MHIIDLRNNMNQINNNYNEIFDDLRIKNQTIRNDLTTIFNISIPYINLKYKTLSKKDRVACTYVLKELYLKGKLRDVQHINSIIDNFFEFNKGYGDHMNKLDVITDQFDADISFYKMFIQSHF